jgi:hypothetical protein
MNTEYEMILNTEKNKSFIKSCFEKIISLNLSDHEWQVLINADTANKKLKVKNKFTYPIIVEVNHYGEIPDSITHIKGYRRYYDDRFFYKGKSYILCNDWYYSAKSEKNTKDTRTPFVKWIESIEHKRNCAIINIIICCPAADLE